MVCTSVTERGRCRIEKRQESETIKDARGVVVVVGRKIHRERKKTESMCGEEEEDRESKPRCRRERKRDSHGWMTYNTRTQWVVNGKRGRRMLARHRDLVAPLKI